MVLKQLTDKFSATIKKYKYVVLVLLIGMTLMLLPTGGKKSEVKTADTEEILSKPSLEERLSEILSMVEGAGQVKVILTVAAGEEVIYQSDADKTDNETSFSTHNDTVTVTDSNRNQAGLVRQIIPESYLGAIVICRGAENPSVRLAIVDAVSKLTGLGANCISVLKMK